MRKTCLAVLLVTGAAILALETRAAEALPPMHAGEIRLALEKLNVLMDRIIDSYARAIAAAGTDPKLEQSRKEWMAQLSTYYKFRNNNSEAGMPEFIAAALQKPLPPKP